MARRDMAVDDLDCHILRELLVGNQPRARPDRATLEGMASRLGVHVNTVRGRIRRLEEKQLFLPLTLQVTPAIGMQYASVFFPLAGRVLTDSQRAELLKVPCISMAIEYIDGVVTTMFAPDRTAIEEAVRAVLKTSPFRTSEIETAGWEHWPKTDPLPLKRHDPAILGWLARDPRTSTAAIARKLGLATRSVELRLEELRKVHGIAMLGGGTGTPEGIAIGHFILDLVQGPGRPAAVEQVTNLCKNYLYRSITPTRIFFAVHAGSTASILAQGEQVRAVKGVISAKTRIVTRWAVNPAFPDYLEEALEGVRARTQPAHELRGAPI